MTINTSPEIRKFRLSELNPAPYNPRRIDDEALAGLDNSLTTIQYLQHIVVNVRDDRNIILGGHQRFKVLLRHGIEEADCVVVDVDEDMEKVINITLNNPEISGQWDLDKLEKLLAETKAYSEDLFRDLRLISLEESLDLNSSDFHDFDEEDDEEEDRGHMDDELNVITIELLPEHHVIFLRLMEKEKISYKSPSKKVQYGLKLGQFLSRMDEEGMI